MTRVLGGLLLVMLGVVPALAQGPTQEQREATLKYLYSLQKPNGGFAADSKPGTPATLPATSSAMRAIKYFGGMLPNKTACTQFVESCYDQKSGGFCTTPGGQCDVRTTALGLMAVAELRIPKREETIQPIIFLCAQTKTFEEMRIAAAAYEAIKAKCELSDSWVLTIRKMMNKDGAFGQGGNVPRETASAVVTLLRLDARVDRPDLVIKTLKAGQLADGGWGKDGAKSDLETTYRVLRCFKMLDARPDTAACRKFVAACRNDDGSYGVQPGQPGNVSATYFAGIVSKWLDEMK